MPKQLGLASWIKKELWLSLTSKDKTDTAIWHSHGQNE